MNIRAGLIISFLFATCCFNAQNVGGIYKINDLLRRIDTTRAPMIINFWSTWCKPCVQELPSFDSLLNANNTFKILLVSLDFSEDIEKKVNPFLKRTNVKNECVLLDEANGNDYINKISEQWSGAIPATLFVKGKKRILVEKKMYLKELLAKIEELKEE